MCCFLHLVATRGLLAGYIPSSASVDLQRHTPQWTQICYLSSTIPFDFKYGLAVFSPGIEPICFVFCGNSGGPNLDETVQASPRVVQHHGALPISTVLFYSTEIGKFSIVLPLPWEYNWYAGSANPENLRQIFQVKLLLECDQKWGDEYVIPASLLEKAEQVYLTNNLSYLPRFT